ncbi:ComEC/Rec2 family competence protein [Psychromicrobium lacuslunae]|uniref:ComEC/Rec2 family competence protein n=1 Tax=Psychromicrobium lacuslunae TaxID=1618207 RepID=UPI0012FF51A1|nr:ComEC/Rec2 family competence protein [Psychromicrobium lacuslunae]
MRRSLRGLKLKLRQPRARGAALWNDVRLLPAGLCCWLAAAAGIQLPAAVAKVVGFSLLGLAILVVVVIAYGKYGAAPLWQCVVTVGLATVFLLFSNAVTTARIPELIQQGSMQRSTLEFELHIDESPTDIGDSLPTDLIAATITRASRGEQGSSVNLPVRVQGDQHWLGLRGGDTVRILGELRPFPGAPKTRLLLLPKTTPTVLSASDSITVVDVLRQRLRADSLSVWAASWPDAAALLPGMTIGDRSGLPPALGQAMKVVGLSHLTAVSGMNCSVVLIGIVLLARTLRLPRYLSALAGILALSCFVIVVGAQASVLRAATMGVLGVVAVLGGRSKQQLALLSTAVLVLLLIDPWLALDFGFLLSVLATFGLITSAQAIQKLLARWLPESIALALAVPLTAQLFCAPVIVLLTPKFSSYALFANILAAPVVTICTLAGIVAIPLLLLAPGFASPLLFISGLGAGWVADVARFFAALPGASLPWPEGVPGVLLMAIAPLLLLAAGVLYSRRGRWVAELLAAAPGLAVLCCLLKALLRGLSLALVMLLGWLASRWLFARLYGLPM